MEEDKNKWICVEETRAPAQWARILTKFETITGEKFSRNDAFGILHEILVECESAEDIVVIDSRINPNGHYRIYHLKNKPFVESLRSSRFQPKVGKNHTTLRPPTGATLNTLSHAIAQALQPNHTLVVWVDPKQETNFYWSKKPDKFHNINRKLETLNAKEISILLEYNYTVQNEDGGNSLETLNELRQKPTITAGKLRALVESRRFTQQELTQAAFEMSWGKTNKAIRNVFTEAGISPQILLAGIIIREAQETDRAKRLIEKLDINHPAAKQCLQSLMDFEHPEVVQLLNDKGVFLENPNYNQCGSEQERNPRLELPKAEPYSRYARQDLPEIDQELIQAAWQGNIKKTREAIQQGANIHAGDNEALYRAVLNNQPGTVRLLLAHGADIHAGDHIAINLAAGTGNLPMLELLVDAGADRHNNHDNPMRSAIDCGQFDTARWLLKTGANIRGKDDNILKRNITGFTKDKAKQFILGKYNLTMLKETQDNLTQFEDAYLGEEIQEALTRKAAKAAMITPCLEI